MSTRFIIHTDLLTFDQSHDFITDAEAYARYLEQNAKTLMLNASFADVTDITSSNGTKWYADDDDEREDLITLDLKASETKIAFDPYDPTYIAFTVGGQSRLIDDGELAEFDTFIRDMFAPVEESNYILASPKETPGKQVILSRQGICAPFKSSDGTAYGDGEVRKNFNQFVVLTPTYASEV